MFTRHLLNNVFIIVLLKQITIYHPSLFCNKITIKLFFLCYNCVWREMPFIIIARVFGGIDCVSVAYTHDTNENPCISFVWRDCVIELKRFKNAVLDLQQADFLALL